jgi:hypothetical protein
VGINTRSWNEAVHAWVVASKLNGYNGRAESRQKALMLRIYISTSYITSLIGRYFWLHTLQLMSWKQYFWWWRGELRSMCVTCSNYE